MFSTLVRKIAPSIRVARSSKATAGKRRMISGKRKHNAYSTFHSFAVVRTRNAGHVGGIVRANRRIDYNRAACAARLRAARLPRRGLPVDTGVLGLCGRRLLLGAGHVGDRSGSRSALDSRLLWLVWQPLCFL